MDRLEKLYAVITRGYYFDDGTTPAPKPLNEQKTDTKPLPANAHQLLVEALGGAAPVKPDAYQRLARALVGGA